MLPYIKNIKLATDSTLRHFTTIAQNTKLVIYFLNVAFSRQTTILINTKKIDHL